MVETLFVYRNQTVIKTGLTAHKIGRNGKIIQEIFQIRPIDGPLDWNGWVSDSELHIISTGTTI